MAAVHEAPRPDTLPGRFWILLVDDEPGLLRLMQRALNRHGWAATPCATVAEALHALEHTEQPPGLVIADLLLPDGEGSQVIGAARARRANVPAIMISGLDEAGDEPLSESAQVFLAKPFAMDQLVDAVRQLTGGPATMTRTLLLPSGARWTVSVIRSPHARQDRRVWLSFAGAVGKHRTEWAAEGFSLEGATDEELLALLERDEWGLLGRADS